MAIPGTHAPVQHPPLLTAFVATAPASPSARLEVNIPAVSLQRSVTVGWAPHTPLPKVGDECLVAYDEHGEPWVVAWQPPASLADSLVMTPMNGEVTIAGEVGRFYVTNKAKELTLPTAAAAGGRIGILKWEGNPSYTTVKPTGGAVILSHGGGYTSMRIWVDQPTTFTTDGGNWWIDGQGGSIGLGTAGRAVRSNEQSIANIAFTTIKVDLLQDVADNSKNFDLVNGRYIVPAYGIYHADASVSIVGGTTGEVICSIARNGTEKQRGTRMPPTGVITNAIATGLFECNAGDYLETWCYQSTGAARNIEISGIENHLAVVRVA